VLAVNQCSITSLVFKKGVGMVAVLRIYKETEMYIRMVK
jgi:hypothetical protein